ncbi:MAG: NAD(P)-dependent oxidoreductase [Candidatus Sedimenticola sp. (ex Thyasira tokunagai)]
MSQVIIVTGAAGYLGQRIVSHAYVRGFRVKAIVRPGSDISQNIWAKHAGIEVIEIDLASRLAKDKLVEVMSEGRGPSPVIIHAAGTMVGDDDFHGAHTVQPTSYIVEAMVQAGIRRLVLISSLSVYGYSVLPDFGQLDETTPSEYFLLQRDAYCRAKVAQEGIVVEAAQKYGINVTALRPGAIIGPRRLWTSRLGIIKGSVVIRFGREAYVPLVYVDHCADAAVLAAEKNIVVSDVYVQPDNFGQCGAFEAINVIDDMMPTQQQYINLLREYTSICPQLTINISWNVMKRIASALSFLAMFQPKIHNKMPGLLKEASLHARIKPLRYSNARLHDRLGWSTKLSCKDVIKLSANEI